MKKNRQCEVVHNGIQRKFLLKFFFDYFHILFSSKILQPLKLLKVGQTTTLCHAQDYIYSLFWDDFCAFSVLDLLWTLNKGFVFSSHVSHDKKVTRPTAKKIQDSNANVDKFELKYKAFCRKNVVRVNASRKTWGLEGFKFF